MWYIVLGLVAALFAVIAFGMFKLNKQRNDYEKKIKEIEKQAQAETEKAKEILKKAGDVKVEARDKDFSDSVNFVADKLHDMAQAKNK